jgi:serine/threonine-protein kinase
VAAVLVRRVADALACAHAQGVVHCDIKPGNIFLLGRDRPKVLDFGIARIAHAGQAGPPKAAGAANLDGVVAGSPHYQAPEQLRGDAVDARTDVYALGTVLYELLTRRRAFGGATVAAIQAAVLEQTPLPPQTLRPGLSPALGAIALRAMQRDPAARYASAADMAQALRDWVDTSAATATRPVHRRGPARRPSAPVGSPRRQLLASGAVLCSMAAAVLGTAWYWGR